MIASAVDTLLGHPLAWFLPVALPLVAAFAVLGAPSRPVAERLAPWTALPALLLAAVPQPARWVDVPWLLLGSRLGLDEMSRVFLFFTALLWLVSGMFASGYLKHDARRHLFMFYFLVAMSGNLGLILAGDMALFYVCFALMSFASYGLVVHRGDQSARRAGRVYIVLVVAGEVLLFSGLAVAASATGSIAWPGLGDRLAGAGPYHWAMWLLFFGLAIKVGALPLHVWLPLAHPAAPVPASAVLSGAMIKAGVIGWLRLVPSEGGLALPGCGELCLVLGVAAIFYGVAVGLPQADPKTVLAYSSISQMGLITVGVGLACFGSGMAQRPFTPILAYAMHHAFAKGALFLGVGVAAMTGAVWQRRLCALGLLIPALALSGMPLTSGALAKAMLKADTAAAPDSWPAALAWLLPLGALGTTLLMARFLWLAWPRGRPTSEPPATRTWLAWAALLVATVLGVFLWPWEGGHVAAKGLLLPAKIVAALWPVALGAAIAAAAGVAARGVRWRVPTIPPGDLLEVAVALGKMLARLGAAPVEIFASRWTPTAGYAKWHTMAGRLTALCHTVELGMRRGAVFGAILLALLGLVLALLGL